MDKFSKQFYARRHNDFVVMSATVKPASVGAVNYGLTMQS